MRYTCMLRIMLISEDLYLHIVCDTRIVLLSVTFRAGIFDWSWRMILVLFKCFGGPSLYISGFLRCSNCEQMLKPALA